MIFEFEGILSSGGEEIEVVVDALVAAVDIAEMLLLSLVRGDDVNGAPRPRISTSTPLFQYLNGGGGAAAVFPPVFDLEGGL
jgi:hypothetical protein